MTLMSCPDPSQTQTDPATANPCRTILSCLAIEDLSADITPMTLMSRAREFDARLRACGESPRQPRGRFPAGRAAGRGRGRSVEVTSVAVAGPSRSGPSGMDVKSLCGLCCVRSA